MTGSSETLWSYNNSTEDGPDKWDIQYPNCKLERQSPIDFLSEKSVSKRFPSFEFSPEYLKSQNNDLLLKNTGHTVQMDFSNGDMFVTGGGLGSKYTLAQFHLHWGSTDGVGSEHRINGQIYPMEMHIVHYDSIRFNNIFEALNSSNGLAVFATFFQITHADNADLDVIIKLLTTILNIGNQTSNVGSINIMKLFSRDLKNFYRYNGSLTTPTCNESVVWTVFTEPLGISTTQVSFLFRAAKYLSLIQVYYIIHITMLHLQLILLQQQLRISNITTATIRVIYLFYLFNDRLYVRNIKQK